MLNVMGHELDFDITAPDDLDRYLRCGEEMSARAAEAPPMPETVTTPEHLRAYTEWCRAYCKICTRVLPTSCWDRKRALPKFWMYVTPSRPQPPNKARR